MKNNFSFKRYIYKVLKDIYRYIRISQRAIQIVDDMVYDCLQRISHTASELAEYNSKLTITSREIQTAVRLTLLGELGKNAVSEGVRAVTRFNLSIPKKGVPTPTENISSKMTKSKSTRSGLKFPVGRVRRYLKKALLGYRIGSGAPIYLAAVLELISAEVLEHAGWTAKQNKQVRISPRHVMLGVGKDEELARLLRGGIIAAGGVLPNIHFALLPATKQTGMYDGVEA